MAAAPAPTAFDFRLAALKGGDFNLADFCGFTPQYAALQKLQDRFAAQGFAVIGVSSNDFNQESLDVARILVRAVEAALSGLASG